MTELNEPLLRTRFTDMAAALFTSQKNPQCQDFEMRYVTCMEAYGRTMGDQKCKDLRDDFKECIFKIKQVKH